MEDIPSQFTQRIASSTTSTSSTSPKIVSGVSFSVKVPGGAKQARVSGFVVGRSTVAYIFIQAYILKNGSIIDDNVSRNMYQNSSAATFNIPVDVVHDVEPGETVDYALGVSTNSSVGGEVSAREGSRLTVEFR